MHEPELDVERMAMDCRLKMALDVAQSLADVLERYRIILSAKGVRKSRRGIIIGMHSHSTQTHLI